MKRSRPTVASHDHSLKCGISVVSMHQYEWETRIDGQPGVSVFRRRRSRGSWLELDFVGKFENLTSFSFKPHAGECRPRRLKSVPFLFPAQKAAPSRQISS